MQDVNVRRVQAAMFSFYLTVYRYVCMFKYGEKVVTEEFGI